MPTPHPHPLARTHTVGAYRIVPDGPLPDGRDAGGPDNAPGWRLDWFVEADLHDPEEGREVNYTGSLHLVLGQGTFSGPWEREIPASIPRRIEALVERLEDADLV